MKYKFMFLVWFRVRKKQLADETFTWPAYIDM